MRCISKKVCYSSRGQAEEALLYTRIKHSGAGSGPVGVYLCPDCHYYHLTSKGKESDLLNSQNKKTLKIQQEADHWIDRFKKK